MKRNESQEIRRKITKLNLGIIDDFILNEDTDGVKRYNSTLALNNKLVGSAIKDSDCMVNVLERLRKSGELNARETTLMAVLSYLLIAEGLICNYLNFVSYLLVTKGHDLFSLIKRKYVRNDLEEINKVEISTKIQFLNIHGFKALTREYDSTLRNDIAHHNYTIDDKGVLRIRGKRVNLIPKLDAFLKIIDILKHSMEESLHSLNEKRKAFFPS